MIKVDTLNYPVYFGLESYAILGEYLNKQNYSKLLLLTDSNCNENCLPYFLAHLPTDIPFEIIEFDAGEEAKTLITCEGVLSAMFDLGIDRYSAVIAVGGGVVTDLAGFVASIYMRGIPCFYVPTTLLSMVDASIGGKTGVDLNGVKNGIGTFTMPKMVVIDSTYLETLPAREIKSGYAEMLKHGLILDKNYYNHLRNIAEIDFSDIEILIYHSVVLKNNVIEADPTEKGMRKLLNFGHTVGHAVESYFLSEKSKERLLHGEAIAIGMIVEAYVSTKLANLTEESYLEIKSTLQHIYGIEYLQEKDIKEVLNWLKFDKKNREEVIRMVLLTEIGSSIYDYEVDTDLIISGFSDYLN